MGLLLGVVHAAVSLLGEQNCGGERHSSSVCPLIRAPPSPPEREVLTQAEYVTPPKMLCFSHPSFSYFTFFLLTGTSPLKSPSKSLEKAEHNQQWGAQQHQASS